MTLVATKVLLIDDSIIIGNRMKEMMESCNTVYLLDQAFNIEDGLKVFESENPGITILDIGFPGNSGMFLIPLIKKLNNSAKVIMFTNYSHKAYQTKCYEMGADEFFDKSTESELLKEYLENFSSQQIPA
jgi:DNA-binding NarL/FixJ family response regulator